MAHAWNACWVNALGGSNPPFSAVGPGPLDRGLFASEVLPQPGPGPRSGPVAQPAEPGPGSLLAGSHPAQGNMDDAEGHLGGQAHGQGDRAEPCRPEAQQLA